MMTKDSSLIKNNVSEMSTSMLNFIDQLTKFDNLDSISDVIDTGKKKFSNDDYCFYKISKISYDDDYPHREAFENILSAINDDNYNFIYILDGDKKGISLYLGIIKNGNESRTNYDSASYYGNILKRSFEGNFPGSRLNLITDDELRTVLFEKNDFSRKGCKAGVIYGVPSVNAIEKPEQKDYQGIDRLINSMYGLKWRMIIVCEPVSKNEISEVRTNIYKFYNLLSIISKRTVQASKDMASTITSGESSSTEYSKSTGTSTSYGEGENFGENSQYSSHGNSLSKNRSMNKSKTEGMTTGKNSSYSTNNGSSEGVSLEIANKHAQELMKYIDEELLKRINLGLSKGMFVVSTFFLAENKEFADLLKNAIKALFQGNTSTYSPLESKEISADNMERFLWSYQNQYSMYEITDENSINIPTLFSRPVAEGQMIGLNTYLTSKEISLLAGLPQKEVPGISLIKTVDFGLNVQENDSEAVTLGNIIQKDRILTGVPYSIGRNSFNKHLFVCGVTGSGKTITCKKILQEANMPFLIIEPAKTEYRSLLYDKNFQDIEIFTVGNESVAPFRINPFELIKGENISAHIDMLKATFTAAFPMEGSMPQMLEEAIIEAYRNKGWDIEGNTYSNPMINPWEKQRNYNCFPTLSDLLSNMDSVVKKFHFGAKMSSEYLGSLKSRLTNLTVGTKGLMLDCDYSVDFAKLVERNVILELEEMKSPEDKALIMGLILARLSEVVKQKYKHNKYFKHLTLVEEAHRLLTKIEPGEHGPKKNAVETFSDLLAEVRKYGESLVIVDQIPCKLAAEVIKNTNTKIVHRLFAQDDKNAIGDTMMMDDKQKEYLSDLRVGQAIIFSENTNKPVHVAIEAENLLKQLEPSDEEVKENFKKHISCLGMAYDSVLNSTHKVLNSFKLLCQHLINKNANCPREYAALEDKIIKCSQESYINETEAWKNLILRYQRVVKNDYLGEKTEDIEWLIKLFSNDLKNKTFDYNDFIEKSNESNTIVARLTC